MLRCMYVRGGYVCVYVCGYVCVVCLLVVDEAGARSAGSVHLQVRLLVVVEANALNAEFCEY